MILQQFSYIEKVSVLFYIGVSTSYCIADVSRSQFEERANLGNATSTRAFPSQLSPLARFPTNYELTRRRLTANGTRSSAEVSLHFGLKSGKSFKKRQHSPNQTCREWWLDARRIPLISKRRISEIEFSLHLSRNICQTSHCVVGHALSDWNNLLYRDHLQSCTTTTCDGKLCDKTNYKNT